MSHYYRLLQTDMRPSLCHVTAVYSPGVVYCFPRYMSHILQVITDRPGFWTHETVSVLGDGCIPRGSHIVSHGISSIYYMLLHADKGPRNIRPSQCQVTAVCSLGVVHRFLSHISHYYSLLQSEQGFGRMRPSLCQVTAVFPGVIHCFPRRTMAMTVISIIGVRPPPLTPPQQTREIDPVLDYSWANV